LKNKKFYNNKFRDLADKVPSQASADIIPQFYMSAADLFYPDPISADKISDAIADSIISGDGIHYQNVIGSLLLRNALADKINKDYNLEMHADKNIIVTSGADAGLFFVIMAFLNKDDEVLIPAPCYPNNFNDVELCGGKSILVPLEEKNGYQICIEEFEKRVSPKTKMVVLTNPNNPTTTVFSERSMLNLCDFVKKHDLILICDQVFEDHVFVEEKVLNPLTIDGMYERTLVLSSISKSHGFSGLRIGYIYGDETNIRVLSSACPYALGAPSSISMIASVKALEDRECLPNITGILKKRKIYFEKLFEDIPFVKLIPIESTMLAWVNISKLGTSEQVCAFLLKDAGISVATGSHYSSLGEGFIRVAYGCYRNDDIAMHVLNKMKESLIKLGGKNNES